MFIGTRLDEAKALTERLGLRVTTVDAAESDVMAGLRRTGMRRVWDPSGWRVVDQYPAPGRPLTANLLVLAIAKPGERAIGSLHLEAVLRERFTELIGCRVAGQGVPPGAREFGEPPASRDGWCGSA